ncbi:MAG: 4'-phosphopantetheinyl transferase superfamily protein [Lachnospiraceae bacterium]|nr:4'-phosphopantetheinyl transferase superfamily protein [Lachnospiraceae bacterium]
MERSENGPLMREEEFLPHIYLARFAGPDKERYYTAVDRLFEEHGAENGCGPEKDESSATGCRPGIYDLFRFCNLEAYAELLWKMDPERMERILNMKVRADRCRSFWAGVLLQFAVYDQTGMYATVSYRKSGKPYIKSPEHMRVSLSHSGDLAVCVLSVTDTGDTVDLRQGQGQRLGICSLGIDVEQERELLHPDKILKYCMDEEELKAFSCCYKDTENDELLHLWTVKESVLKCFGTGLGASPKLAKVFPGAFLAAGESPVIRESSLQENVLKFGEAADESEIPLLVHWKVSAKDLSYLERGSLAELEHYVSQKRREACAKWPEPLCEADGAPVRYACYTGEMETESGRAWLSLCLKLYVGGSGDMGKSRKSIEW